MTALDRLTGELPANIIANLRQVVADWYAQYEQRDCDYFEHMEEHSNWLDWEKRGAEAWKHAREARQDYMDNMQWGECWLSELTGDRVPTFMSPGWYFPTFAGAIRDEFKDIILDYIRGDMDNMSEEWDSFYGEHYDVINDLIEACATEFSDDPAEPESEGSPQTAQ